MDKRSARLLLSIVLLSIGQITFADEAVKDWPNGDKPKDARY